MGPDARGAVVVALLVVAVVGASVVAPRAAAASDRPPFNPADASVRSDDASAADATPLGEAFGRDGLFRLTDETEGTLAGAVRQATREGRPVDVRVLMGEGRSQEWQTVTAQADGSVIGRDGRLMLSSADARRTLLVPRVGE